MGIAASLVGKGLSPKLIVSLASEAVYKNLLHVRSCDFEEFHSSVLSIFETANAALPGRHYEAPSRAKVQTAFNKWKMSSNEDRKKIFMELLESTKLGKIDNLTLIVGLAAPPFSVVVKRAGENAAPFTKIKNVPDALFVPSFTVLSLFSVRLIRKVLEKMREDKDEAEDTNAHP